MKIKYLPYLLLICLIFLTGCEKKPESALYTKAFMDALYKGSYSDYASLTGATTTSLSTSRSEWIESEKEVFLEYTGVSDPSDEMSERITNLLSGIYAVASYEVTDGEEEGQVVVTIRPMTAITDQKKLIKKTAKKMNKANKNFEYAEISTEEYKDSYLDTILTAIESKLVDMSYGDPVTVTFSLEKLENGYYQIPKNDLRVITSSILLFE